MIKEKPLTIFLVLFFLFIFLAVFLYKPYIGQYYVEKVRVDSISYRNRYEFLPDKMWCYYTKYGTIYNSTKKYNVGDSIEVRYLKIKK